MTSWPFCKSLTLFQHWNYQYQSRMVLVGIARTWLFALLSTILLDSKMRAWLPYWVLHRQTPPQKQISTQRHLINSCASHNWRQILILLKDSKSKAEQNIFDWGRGKENLVAELGCLFSPLIRVNLMTDDLINFPRLLLSTPFQQKIFHLNYLRFLKIWKRNWKRNC